MENNHKLLSWNMCRPNRVSSLVRDELRGGSCGISHPANGRMTRGCPRCCAKKPFKTRSDIACPITEASVADHKMLPDLSHRPRHTHTCTHTESLLRVKMLPVNSHLSCVRYFLRWNPRNDLWRHVDSSRARPPSWAKYAAVKVKYTLALHTWKCTKSYFIYMCSVWQVSGCKWKGHRLFGRSRTLQI